MSVLSLLKKLFPSPNSAAQHAQEQEIFTAPNKATQNTHQPKIFTTPTKKTQNTHQPKIFIPPTKGMYEQNTYLHVPYNEKDIAKQLGAKWDALKKQWFIPYGVNTVPFSKWLPSTSYNLRSNYFFLAQTQRVCFKCSNKTIINAIILPNNFEAIDESAIEDCDNETLLDEIALCQQNYESIASYVTYISGDALVEIEKRTNNYRSGFSITTNSYYYMSICEHCASPQGDNYIISEYNAPFNPTQAQDFSKISFQKIQTSIQLHAGGWSVGYLPLASI